MSLLSNRFALWGSSLGLFLSLLSCDSRNSDESAGSVQNSKSAREISALSHSRSPEAQAREGALAGEELDQLIDKIKAVDVSKVLTSEYSKLSLELIKSDPALALETLYTGQALLGALNFEELCDEMYSEDPDRLLKWLREDLPELTGEGHVIGVYWMKLAKSVGKKDPDAALSLILSSAPPELSLDYPIRGLLYMTALENHQKALDLVHSLPENLRDIGLVGLADASISDDPARAYALTSEISDIRNKSSILSRIFDRWLSTDPVTAVEEIKKLSGDEFERMGIAEVNGQSSTFLNDLGKLDPELLREKLGQVMPSSKNAKMFERAIQGLAGADFNSAMGVIKDLPASPLRNSLLAKSFMSIGKPEEVSKYVEAISELSADDQRHAIRGFGEAISEKPLDEIVALSQNFEGANSSQFLRLALSENYSLKTDELQERIANRELLQTMSPEDAGQVVWQYSGRITEDIGEGAFEWYEELHDDQKLPAIKGIALVMSRSNIESLSKWLNSLEQNAEWRAGASVLVANLKQIDVESANVWEEALRSSSDEE